MKGGLERLIAWHSLAMLDNYQDTSLPQIGQLSSPLLTEQCSLSHSECEYQECLGFNVTRHG